MDNDDTWYGRTRPFPGGDDAEDRASIVRHEDAAVRDGAVQDNRIRGCDKTELLDGDDVEI